MASLSQLEYALAVQKYGHFSKAAKECHITQPSLSMQIQKLEEELDLIIFDRGKKPVKVTSRGKKVLTQARVILREFEKLKTFSHVDDGQPQGRLNLAVIPTLSPYIIPLFINEFSKKYPLVELYIEEYQTEEILELLDTDKIDAGLLVTPLKDHRFIERTLFYEPFYLYLSKDHPLLKKKIVKQSELESDDIWLLDEGHCFRNQTLSVCNRKGIDSKTVLENIHFQSGSLETLKNLVRRKRGYTLLPELATQGLSSSEKKNLIRSFAPPTPSREVSLVHSRAFYKEQILDALEE